MVADRLSSRRIAALCERRPLAARDGQLLIVDQRRHLAPAPRREWSVRKDYQVLIGTNRHTITPTGWIQEENNLKGVLTNDRALATDKPYVGREYGVARYDRLQLANSAADFGAADEYFERTKQFWDEVRDAWSASFEKTPTITLRAQVDQSGLFVPLFEQADQITAGQKPTAADKALIEKTLQDMQTVSR